MSSPNDGSDDELREAVSKNETRAELGGAAVVFGLVVEVVLTATYRHGKSIIEVWGPVFADALIALGVAAEILFARKARSKAEALQHRLDAQVTIAQRDANIAAERAALLEVEAGRLRLALDATREETARISQGLASRHVSEPQKALIASILRGNRFQLLIVSRGSGEEEIGRYIEELADAFRAAGIVVNTRPDTVIPPDIGITVVAPRDRSSSLVAMALDAAQIPFAFVERREIEVPIIRVGVRKLQF